MDCNIAIFTSTSIFLLWLGKITHICNIHAIMDTYVFAQTDACVKWSGPVNQFLSKMCSLATICLSQLSHYQGRWQHLQSWTTGNQTKRSDHWHPVTEFLLGRVLLSLSILWDMCMFKWMVESIFHLYKMWESLSSRWIHEDTWRNCAQRGDIFSGVDNH